MRLKGGWYDTGDLGLIDDEGYIWHKGRLKRFVKIAGEMISLVAIEEALDRVTEPDIECCAIELPDAKRGAKIVAVTSQVVDPAIIAKKLANELPNIALPKKYITVLTFPRMGSGKTDFRGLTEQILHMEKNENSG